MSLIRPTDLSVAYESRKLYSLKGSNEIIGLSNQIYGPDRKLTYAIESPCSQGYDPNYLLDSPIEELIHPAGSGGLNNTSFLDTTNSDQCIFYAELFENESPHSIGCSEEMRLRLLELEKALLDDNVENDEFGREQVMEIDGEWAPSTQNAMLHDSPKEASSSDSNMSSISSNKEVVAIVPRTPKELLFYCASSMSEGNTEEASNLINELRQIVSIQGDPALRIAAYMLEGLTARMAASGKFLYKALKCKEATSHDRLAAMQILFEVCPCFKFGFVAANGAMIEAFSGEKRVHIVDFDINQGSQYITLIQTLAKSPGMRPYLRLTGVDDPESVQRTIGGLKIIGQRLEKLAEALGLPFEFHAVASRTSNVTPNMLDCRAGEALVVNFTFQLHHMPDESVSTVNQRDKLLRMVKGLNPKLVTIVEQDVNTNTTPFLQRFADVYNYYSAVFDSLDATLPRESQDRINVEKQCLARDIVNIVACEGEERIERYELAGKWRARMMMAGFTPCPISHSVTESIKVLIRQYCNRFKLKEEMGGLHFGWEDKNLIVTSAWR